MLDLFPEIGRRRLDSPRLEIDVAPSIEHAIKVSGHATCWITRAKSGSMVRKPWRINNGATTSGLNYLLNTGFRNQSQITTWYAGVIAAAGFSGVSVNDTMGSHTGWAEFVGYSESVRQTWSPGTAAAGVVVNSAAMAFTVNANSNAQGIFIASVSTKSDGTGTLWSTAVEASPFSLTSGVVFNAIYQITLTPVS